ncbi:MAG: ATP-binding protein [Ruminococcus sp.]|nr:ATP-binding protein [Ruminococcus sp.]
MAKYSEEVFRKAEAVLNARRADAENRQKLREAEICEKHPEIAKIRYELRNTGIRFMAVLKEARDISGRTEELKQRNLDLQKDQGDLLEAFTGDRDYLKTKYTCPVCNDTGFTNGKRCRCFDELLRSFASAQLTDDCGIALHDFSEFRTDVYPNGGANSDRAYMQTLCENCIDYAEGFSLKSASLLFCGKTGLGKTLLSSCIAKKAAERGFSVAFGSVSVYLRKIEGEHFGREAGNTLSLLESCDLLILDDLGSEFKTPFYDAVLYEIINSRINSHRPTIISTNLSLAELNSNYNERIVSRLMGFYAPMMFRGNDVRQIIRNY